MILTERDLALLKDLALSHVMSRDQLMQLGYFGSVTRVNTRLRALAQLGLIRRLETPFFTQGLFCATKKASEFLGDRVGRLIAARTSSPRYIQHALMVTNVRIEMTRRGLRSWRFEQQLWRTFDYGGDRYQIKPDGLAILPDKFILVEVDLGHVSARRFADKLNSFDAFVASGLCQKLWSIEQLRILTLTTTERRAELLQSQTPPQSHFLHFVRTFDAFNVPLIGAWS